MRKFYVYVIAFAIVPLWAFAAGYGGAEGRNRRGQLVLIPGDTYYELYVIRSLDQKNWPMPFDMNANCPEFGQAMLKGVGATFTCPPQRAFPLADTTYRITTSRKYRPCDEDPFYDKTPGIVYVCVKGCDSVSAPAIIKERPWECN